MSAVRRSKTTRAPPEQGYLQNYSVNGYCVVPDVLTQAECDHFAHKLPGITSAGTRTLLAVEPFGALADRLMDDPRLAPLLAHAPAASARGEDKAPAASARGEEKAPAASARAEKKSAVQCVLFRKTQDHNWALRLHRDAVLPIAGSGPWPDAGFKEQVPYVRAPASFVRNCVAVRVNLDDAAEGDLRLVPGSHLRDADVGSVRSVPVPRGGALVFCPGAFGGARDARKTEHGSNRLSRMAARRVLHFLFGPPQLPYDYEWWHARPGGRDGDASHHGAR